jgi:hypothetical protein
MNKETITRITLEEAINTKGLTDWEAVDTMTEEEVEQNALDDPDNPPMPEDKKGFKRTYRQWSQVAKDDR